ncbi:hypothetical protein QQZ08_001141 [Neonectria magnoliae]|uniref:Amidase domain-containing protein n=1 Tax=Neonectria magnoliae TaxID=2732573 RepID=A0ABR1IH90_9HYPO
MTNSNSLSLVEASISDLRQALDSQASTSVELVSLYLHSIGKYDCRGPSLNSSCVPNHNVLEEAQVSDDYRASGRPPRPLEGIPFTVKDSFKVKGLTDAAGSPALADLVASSDTAVVESLREAGAILLGKMNMPPMVDGGSQRGLYGRAESPYNPVYSTTAYASGSSNGSGTSTTASFAAFGFAGETTFVPIPSSSESSEVRPINYHSLEDSTAIQAKRIAVPRYILGAEGTEPKTLCSALDLELFNRARADLEALGATVIESDFALLEQYAKKGLSWTKLQRVRDIARVGQLGAL